MIRRKLQLIVLLSLVGVECKGIPFSNIPGVVFDGVKTISVKIGKEHLDKGILVAPVISFILSQKASPHIYERAVYRLNKLFYPKESALKEFEKEVEFNMGKLDKQGTAIRQDLKVYRIGHEFMTSTERKTVITKIKQLTSDYDKNLEEKNKLRAQAVEKLGQERADKLFNSKQAAAAH